MTPLKPLLLSAAASIALAACGGGDDAGTSASTNKSEMAASASPIDTPFTLADAEPLDVDAFLAELGVAEMVSYDSASFDESLGATVITNFKPMGAEGPTSIGRVELYGFDTDVFAEMSAGEPMAAMADLFQKVRMFDVSHSMPLDMPGGSMSFSAGALEIDTFSLQIPDEPGEDAGEGQEMALAAKAFKAGGMAMKDMDLDINAGDQGAFDIKAADVRIGSYEAGKFGGMVMKNLAFDIEQSEATAQMAAMGLGEAGGMIMNSPLRNILFPAKQGATMEEFTWDGFSFAGLLPYLESGEKPPVSATDLLSIGGMEFLGQVSTVNGKTIGTVGRTSLEPIEFMHFMPKRIAMVSKDAVTDLTAYIGDEDPNGIADILRQNGFDNIKGESDFVFEYNDRRDTITITSEGVAKGLYAVDMDIKVSDFDYPTLAGDDEAATEAAAMKIAFDGMTFALKDEKFVDTAFQVAGAITEQDAQALRGMAGMVLAGGSAQFGEISPRIPEYVGSLVSFLNEGGTLEIKAAPSSPVTIEALAALGESENPAEILDTLNLTVNRK